MSDHVYKSVEITGSSEAGIQQSIDNALAKAGKTLRNIDWFEVAGIRGGLGRRHDLLPGHAQDRLPAGGLRAASPRRRARPSPAARTRRARATSRRARPSARPSSVVHALQRRGDPRVAAGERLDQRLPAVGERLHLRIGLFLGQRPPPLALPGMALLLAGLAVAIVAGRTQTRSGAALAP